MERTQIPESEVINTLIQARLLPGMCIDQGIMWAVNVLEVYRARTGRRLRIGSYIFPEGVVYLTRKALTEQERDWKSERPIQILYLPEVEDECE